MSPALRHLALGSLIALAGLGFGSASIPPAAAQGCHPAYGGCIPDVPYDLNCADIGYAVVQVWDVYWDPYGLDTWDGPGNGWTCDSYS